MTESPDRRITPWRPDLAARSLEGTLTAERYEDGVAYQVSAGICPVRKEPLPYAEQLSQALPGDTVTVYEERDGFGWGQMASDGYVGWFDMEALSAPVLPVTHRIRALRTYVFSEPDIKSAPVCLLSLNAHIVAEGDEGRFVKAARAGWVVANHLDPLDVFEADPAGVAERFLGAPYQWGGKESLGLDCSGLIQMALHACGKPCPRDSDMQRSLGTEVSIADGFHDLMRGDVICWKGHVGMMLDNVRMIHANAYHMAVAIEPLAEAVRRILPVAGEIITVRRP